MSVSAIKAGAAFYEIFVKDRTKEGLDTVDQHLSRIASRIGLMGAAMAGFSAAGLTAVGAMVKAFASAGDDISDAMNVTGLSSSFLQTLQFGAADAGVAFDALVGSITKSNKLLADAAAGGKKANATLATLGLTSAGLMALSPDERFKALADAIERIPDPAQRAAAAMSVFGKSGAKLLPALEGGAAALNEQMAELQSKGLIMSDEDRQLATKAEGAYLSLSLAISRVSQVIAAAATPAFLAVFDVLQTVVEGVVQFIDANRSLVAGITIGLGVIGAVGAALMFVGGAVGLAGLAISGLGTAFAAVGAVIGAILSPIGLIVIAVTACGAAALLSAYYLDQLFNGGAALQFLSDMAEAAMTAMQLLWTAISNGRWDLAGRLITDGLNLAFTSGILALKQGWIGFANWLSNLLVEVMQSVSQTVIGNMRTMLDNLASITGNNRFTAMARVGLAGVGIGLEAAATTVTAGTAKANQWVLGETPQDTVDAAAALAKTMAEINALDTAKKDDLRAKAAAAGMADFGDLSNQMKQSSLLSGVADFGSSIGARHLGLAAPGNDVQQKQLEALQDIAKGQDNLIDAVEGLEGLAFE